MTNKCTDTILGYSKLSNGRFWDPVYLGSAHERPLVLHKITGGVADVAVDGLGVWRGVGARSVTPVTYVLNTVRTLRLFSLLY